jgi:hypothetical protein
MVNFIEMMDLLLYLKQELPDGIIMENRMALSFEVIVDDRQPLIIYRRHGKFHRINGPAMLLKIGTQFWHQYGQFHRTDGPAIIWSDGDKRRYIRGVRK